MSELLLPAFKPPQASEDVVDKILFQAITEGIGSSFSDAEFYMRAIQPSFRDFLYDGLEEKILRSSAESHHKREFRAGAMIAAHAYLESGYHIPIDEESLELGISEAQMEGLPNAFHTRTATDHELLRLITALPREEVGLGLGMHSTEYEDILSRGAGCARFMLQQAMAA